MIALYLTTSFFKTRQEATRDICYEGLTLILILIVIGTKECLPKLDSRGALGPLSMVFVDGSMTKT